MMLAAWMRAPPLALSPFFALRVCVHHRVCARIFVVARGASADWVVAGCGSRVLILAVDWRRLGGKEGKSQPCLWA